MSDQLTLAVDFSHIEEAAKRLENIAHQTPILTSTTVNDLTQAQVFFKCENFQRTGSFKFRGAYNALSQIKPNTTGVLTFSSGNHAQAIALSGKLLNIPTTIIMPTDAPVVKQSATRGYGGNIVFYDRKTITREELAAQLASDNDMTVIPPYDHQDIIAGQGTTAKELITTVEKLDILLVCCGGGGLLSGCGIACKTLLPHCRVIGVEPEKADDATRSFYSKTLQSVDNPQTIADGARTPYLGKLTFPLVLHYVDEMVTVTEEEIISSMRFLWERLKIVVEPTGALATAALLNGKINTLNQRVGIIISGGNVNLP